MVCTFLAVCFCYYYCFFFLLSWDLLLCFIVAIFVYYAVIVTHVYAQIKAIFSISSKKKENKKTRKLVSFLLIGNLCVHMSVARRRSPTRTYRVQRKLLCGGTNKNTARLEFQGQERRTFFCRSYPFLPSSSQRGMGCDGKCNAAI